METDLSKIEKQFSAIEDEKKRSDSFRLLKLMQNITGEPPALWRGNMIGFGKYKYTYESGRSGEWFLTGFCPRKSNLVVYIMAGFKNYERYLSEIGSHKTGSSCLYFKNLDSVNIERLGELIRESVKYTREKHGA